MTFPVFAGNSASTGYNLTRSLRFRASASAYLNRTPATAGNRKTFTLSTWVKRGTLGARQSIFDAYAASAGNSLEFQSNDILEFYAWGGASVFDLATTQVFRDPSAWYHIVVAVDTTQATAANRIKLYINGSQVTAFGTATYPSLNADLYINNNFVHNIGRRGDAQFYFDGYTTEVNFVDGQQLTPSSFGSTNALTGVWQPARYTGSYGTNGFYLPFTDNSALTTSSNVGLGKDFSGNGNYWTTNNISITAGVTYDSMTDVPTLTSATAANFAVLNPLNAESGMTGTPSGGNLNIAVAGGKRSTIAARSGKWYWEFVSNSGAASNFPISGIYVAGLGTFWPGYDGNSFGYFQGGDIYYNGTIVFTASSFTNGDIIGFAWDADTGKVYVSKNNTWQNSGNPAAGTGQVATISTGVDRVVGAYLSTGSCSINFGQRPFSYTPPTGFVALNTYNLPTSTIVKGNTVMDATLYTGNSSTQSIVNAAAFKPDFVWLKARSQAYSNALYDSVRGATKTLLSNTTDAEVTEALSLTAFNSNGFALSTQPRINETPTTYVGWQWQAGQGSTSTNTNGSITSTVSVNASAGFSVVTYTGTLTGTPSPMPTVGHGLGVAPSLVISKSRNVTGVDSGAWFVWTSAQATDNYLRLNTTAASASISGGGGGTMVAPTSSVFSTPYVSGANINANTYVAYCWTPIAGFSAFGSYTGNGSTDGVFVYTGFRPKFVIIKRTDAIGDWYTFDSVRDPYNATAQGLSPNASASETTYTGWGDLVSNGFKIRRTDGAWNASGGTYIYMVYAENPFRNALAR
jgi:hypothetical protein